MHWTLAVAFIQDRVIEYYDSMGGCGERFLKAILQWLVDEAKEKKKVEIDKNSWHMRSGEHVPQQHNGFDCGVFTCVACDFISDGLPLQYQQRDMSFFRRSICASILRGSIRHIPIFN